VTDNLADWPWTWGAPVIDGDGDPDNYNLAGGDRPELLGHQTLWWVMNDRGNQHIRSNTIPMGLEVQGSAYAYYAGGSLGNTTFYHYRLRYTGKTPLEEAFLSLFMDPDLGVAFDDWIGSDTTLALGYVYNADNDDELSRGGYGEAPPALGVTVLQGPLGQDEHGAPAERGLASFTYYNGGGGVTGDPGDGSEMYLYMQARWKDGQPVTLGGVGRDFSTIPTRFFYSGDPTTCAFWTECNQDGEGTPIPPADRRFVATTGPSEMQPGEVQDITLAIVWSRGRDHLDSVRSLKRDVAHLRADAEAFLTPTAQAGLPRPQPQPVLGFAQAYPNPFSANTTIRYRLPQTMHVRLAVYDVLGREVALLVDERQEGGTYEVPFEAGSLPPGVYLYRIALDHRHFTRTMTLLP
jgi:hypothetical protein